MKALDKCINKQTILAFVTMMTVLVMSAGPAEAGLTGNQGLTRLVGAPSGFLPDHYDQRGGTFDSDSAGVFDDGADVVLTGTIPGIGKAIVEASAAWDFGTYTGFVLSGSHHDAFSPPACRLREWLTSDTAHLYRDGQNHN